jgi:hypothetical protein
MGFFDCRFLQYFRVFGVSMIFLGSVIILFCIFTNQLYVLVNASPYLYLLIGIGVIMEILSIMVQPTKEETR